MLLSDNDGLEVLQENQPSMPWSSPGFGYGSALKSTPSTTANTVVASAMLSAMTPITVAEYHGVPA